MAAHSGNAATARPFTPCFSHLRPRRRSITRFSSIRYAIRRMNNTPQIRLLRLLVMNSATDSGTIASGSIAQSGSLSHTAHSATARNST